MRTGAALTAAALVGTWRLVAFHDLDDRGDRSTGPLGAEPRGLLVYTADGHVSVNMMRGDGADPGGTRYMGYAGGWRVDGDRVLHSVGITPNPAWVDTEQVRDAVLDGDRLTLVGVALVDGRPRRRLLEWARVGP
ncbi:lipocalin-like domain-containing protein [Saccharothrix xinjiangensis]|uniref:Lipocalin-like domain-containing protein n=1 Tax=Saccharothrix xinjiangensis TaxID=204798 RepID=A0ABV9Y641_9PSEU